jgi:hypothetical protein
MGATRKEEEERAMFYVSLVLLNVVFVALLTAPIVLPIYGIH